MRHPLAQAFVGSNPTPRTTTPNHPTKYPKKTTPTNTENFIYILKHK